MMYWCIWCITLQKKKLFPWHLVQNMVIHSVHFWWRLKRIEFRRLRAGGQLADYENAFGSVIWTDKWDLKDNNKSIHWMIWKEKEAYVFVCLSAQVCRYWAVLQGSCRLSSSAVVCSLWGKGPYKAIYFITLPFSPQRLCNLPLNHYCRKREGERERDRDGGRGGQSHSRGLPRGLGLQ